MTFEDQWASTVPWQCFEKINKNIMKQDHVLHKNNEMGHHYGETEHFTRR